MESEAEMFLDANDLAALTGLKRPGAQYEWLKREGWPVERDARGRPLVLRVVVEARMGACVGGSLRAEPDFGALRG
jgi:hypothetical protein